MQIEKDCQLGSRCAEPASDTEVTLHVTTGIAEHSKVVPDTAILVNPLKK